MLKSIGFFISAIWLCLFSLKAQATDSAQNASSVFLSYNEYNSHAVYDTCACHGSGTALSFLFNAHKPDAFLAYQDDGTYSNFDLFLINGKIRARIHFDECPWKELVIKGNFSDSRWHRVHLTRELSNLTLTVDGCHSQTIPCVISSSEQEKWQALYVGNIPLNIRWNSLANPGILRQALAFPFQGCIGHVIQNLPGESPKPLPLRYSTGTGQGCESRCVFGGKCDNHIDDDTGNECECPGYGIKELTCKPHKSPVSNYLMHVQTITTSSSNRFNGSKTFFSEITPSLISSSQSRVLFSVTSLTNIVVSSTRPQSASDRAVESVPRNLTSSEQHGWASVPSRLSRSADVSFSSSVDNKAPVMAKKSIAFSLTGSCISIYLGLIVLFQNDFIII